MRTPLSSRDLLAEIFGRVLSMKPNLTKSWNRLFWWISEPVWPQQREHLGAVRGHRRQRRQPYGVEDLQRWQQCHGGITGRRRHCCLGKPQTYPNPIRLLRFFWSFCFQLSFEPSYHVKQIQCMSIEETSFNVQGLYYARGIQVVSIANVLARRPGFDSSYLNICFQKICHQRN